MVGRRFPFLQNGESRRYKARVFWKPRGTGFNSHMETESKVYSFQMMKYWDQESLPKTRTPQRAIFLKEEQNRGGKKSHTNKEKKQRILPVPAWTPWGKKFPLRICNHGPTITPLWSLNLYSLHWREPPRWDQEWGYHAKPDRSKCSSFCRSFWRGSDTHSVVTSRIPMDIVTLKMRLQTQIIPRTRKWTTTKMSGKTLEELIVFGELVMEG